MKHQAQTSGRQKFQSSNNSLTASVARRAPAGAGVSPAAKLRAARQKKPRAANPNALANAALETLEGRELMSASIGVANGILTLQADPQTSSRMIVRLSHEGQQVTASINGQEQSFDLKNLKGVQMTGSSKDDVMRVDERITLPTTMNAGAGNDRIYGGGGADHIDCGDGNDYANGRGGNDNISGGNGNDTLVGGAGSDYLDGGAGNDSLYGRTGNDSIVGDTGTDTLWGGVGNDTLDGSAGADVINGQSGRNRIVQGAKDRVHFRRGDVVVNSSNTNTNPPTVQLPKTPKVGGSNSGGSRNNSGSTNNNPTTDPPPVINTGGGTENNGGSSQNSGGQNNGNPNTSVTGQTADGTQANIQFIEATGMAGHSVHVNALGSTLGTGDALNAQYSWDFGDPGSRFNTLIGWTAGHIYDTPGTYTVTLTVTDSAGQTSTATGTVTITADTRNVIYVDTNGSDANTGASPSAAVKTIDRANELLTGSSTILFHAGQTFDVSDTLSITHSNVIVGAYGNGNAPVLRKVTGTGSSIIMVQPGANDVLVEGIVFDSMWTIEKYGDGRVAARGIYVAGNNFAVRNCQFYNVDDAINAAAGPTGVIVQDNYFGMQVRGNCIWGEGFDHVYIGNTMTNSTQEHLIRCADTGVTRLLIENNSFSRPDNNKGSLELRTAQWFYVRGNRIDGGTLRMGLPNGALPPADQVAWGVVEGNETFGVFVNFRPGASHISLRDNVIHYDDGVAINIETKYSAVTQLTTDIRIDHNTVISESNKAQFVQLDGPANAISVTNNLLVAPNLTWIGTSGGGVIIAGTDLSSFAQISNNVWPQIPTSSSIIGDNYMYGTLYDYNHGYIPNNVWESYTKVANEQYDNVDVSGDQYSVTLNGTTAGATSDEFDPNAYKVAVKKAA